MKIQREKTDWQFWISMGMMGLGIWFIYDSNRVFEIDQYYSGIIIGFGIILIFWGFREMVGSQLRRVK